MIWPLWLSPHLAMRRKRSRHNPLVTGSVLSPAETRAVSALLTRAWGAESEIRGAELIWDRSVPP